MALFAIYVRRYLRRHFAAVRLQRAGPGRSLARHHEPTIVVVNHPSWWDPLTGLAIGRHLFPRCAHFAPIDARALARYPFLERLGLFGVEPGPFPGAARFLQSAVAIAETSGAVLWVTAQGTFRDVRERPLVLETGAAHVARRVGRGRFLPLALEYTFWDQRLPEALACVGDPIPFASLALDRPRKVTEVLAARLEETLDRLADAAQSRDATRFETILAGRTGVGGVYDAWRRARALLAGRRFEPAHQVSTS
ncbi:MAG: glycerol acyltransferase [Planctomycetota bacterium]|nr:MAG: glycerol acyltransferase [Planctomycetota bacterium]